MREKQLSTVITITLGLLYCRSVLAVPTIDLANTAVPGGSITTTLGTVEFIWDQLQPSGTGVLQSFVRIQRNGTEQGYNTTQPNAGALPFEEKFGNFTHDVSITALEAMSGNYQFVLDIGEPVSGTNSLLSLDGLKLYSTATPMQNGNAIDGNGDWVGPTGDSLLWDMDQGMDRWILLDANRNGKPGNGVSDMLMNVPEDIINAAPVTQQYFILWSRFGLNEQSNTGAGSFGTFEEWSQVLSSNGSGPPEQIPEPGILALFGIGLVVVGATGMRRGRRATRQ
jgi:hypothetical protein